jgi:RNA polymerase sigma-54 factor
MAIFAKLELRQGQALVMTPQLQQAIKLLQLSNAELSHFVDTELERNPLLERVETTDVPTQATEPAERLNDSDTSGASGDSDGSTAPEVAGLDYDKTGMEQAVQLDTDFENVYPDTAVADMAASAEAAGWASLKPVGGSFDGGDGNFEDYVSNQISLKDHLTSQLPLLIAHPGERLIGQYIIDMVDDAGYMSSDLTPVAEKLGAPMTLVNSVLTTMQTMDPPGVFARSLAECLALQLKEQNRYDPQIAALLENLPMLANHNLSGLKRVIGVDSDELSDMIAEIKRLNPKPGLKFGTIQMQAVVPDILVRSSSDGSWIIELNSETLPRVLINRSYLSRVSVGASAGRDKDYLMDCLQTANWLVKSLDQRARTILKVAEEIVRQQDQFFTHGVQHLRPLNLKTVADAIKMHESTVSRVTSNKYMSCPRGIFELKYFFTSAIQSAGDGEAHSSESVRHRIRSLIDSETARAILSDDMIVDRLRGDGVDIARRTVAKYREALRIPSSVQRRRDKQLTDRSQRPS